MPKWSKEPIGTIFPTTRPPGEVSQGTKVLRAICGLLGIAAAIVVGVWMYDRTDSVWPAVFVGIIALQLVARAIPDLITESKRIRRALYFALGPGVAGAVFYFSYQWWETYWLSFVLAVILGGTLVAILAPLLFPAIHKEEKADTASRWGVGAQDT
jgi:peptidoglycan/LPS O-acetylase OafA/YrhL